MRRSFAHAVIVVVLAAGCGGGGEPAAEVVLVTHDSFAVSRQVRRTFEQESGLKLRVLHVGDAGAMLNRALLTEGNPEGDVLFGIDDALVTRALETEVFEAYESPELAHVARRYRLDPKHRVTPIDRGDVCLNLDRGWFSSHGIAPPTSLDDLTQPRYDDLLVVQNPATSSPGLAFLLATIARYGEEGWQHYWRRLRANGVLVVDGWEEAYNVRFSGSSGGTGTRPIVVSYGSSPAAEVIFAGKPLKAAPTVVAESTCYRQIEFAAILRGARNEAGAKKLVDFLLSPAFQRDVPLSMFVYPVREGVVLPREFARWAVMPERPLELTTSAVGRNRDRWIREWTSVVLR